MSPSSYPPPPLPPPGPGAGMPMPCRGIIHHVRPGDTLFGIANMHHLSVSQLIYANPYTDVYHLTPGDELCVPIVGP